MYKNKSLKIATILFFTVVLSVAVFLQPAASLISQNAVSWYQISDTNAAVVATGDINGDGQTEIVTGGYYNDGSHWNAQLSVWNSSTLTLESTKVWLWGTNTQISSIALANITGRSYLEIVTGGSYFDGTRWVAALSFWNGATMTLDAVKTWSFGGDTMVSSVAAANITGGSALEIIAGGSYFDGTRWVAALSFYNGASLALDAVKTWNWGGDTVVSSIVAANLTGRAALEIIAGGYYNDGTHRVAAISFWYGSTLALDAVKTWNYGGDTEVSSVTASNITGRAALEIIAGGYYNDGTRRVATLSFWYGATLASDAIKTWFVGGDTVVSSVAVANITGGPVLDVVTGGSYNDTGIMNAQLNIWNGASLASISVAHWSLSNIQINSVAVGNFGEGNRIVTSGSYFYSIRSNAQLVTWG